MTRVVLTTVFACCALIAGPIEQASAHAGHSHGTANIVVPETADGVLQDIRKHHAAIRAAVSGKNLKAVHDHAE